jgi:hypothetical protein
MQPLASVVANDDVGVVVEFAAAADAADDQWETSATLLWTTPLLLRRCEHCHSPNKQHNIAMQG